MTHALSHPTPVDLTTPRNVRITPARHIIVALAPSLFLIALSAGAALLLGPELVVLLMVEFWVMTLGMLCLGAYTIYTMGLPRVAAIERAR